MLRLRWLSVLVVGLLVVLGARPSAAQITAEKGAIRLSVSDQQGAGISGAKVSVKSPTTVGQTKETGVDGSVVFPLLEPGTYQIAIESQNFKRTILSNVAVHITEVTNLNVQLELGSISTEITVSGAGAETINTTNATLGNVLTGDILHNLPLATRNFTYLLALNAGTSADLPDPTVAGHGAAFVFVAGQRGTNNNLVINGTDANDLGSNNFQSVAVPSPDSLEEFRVQTSLYDASQGKTSGGNINVLTRGGTDKYHGEAYEFLRNDDFNANTFFQNAGGNPRPVLKQNQFGGNFGGPVVKLHDTFFFVSYEGTRQINGVAGGTSLNIPVYPTSRSATDIANAFLPPGQTVDPVILQLLNLPGPFGGFLVPSGKGTVGQFGNFSVSEPLRFTEDQFNANVDRNIGTKNKISERFFFANGNTINPLGGEDAGGFGSGSSGPAYNRLATLAWTYTGSANLVNEARIGYDRLQFGQVPKSPALLSQIGMTRFNSAEFPDIPLFFTDDAGEEFGGISTNNDQATTEDTLHFTDTVAFTRGKHTFRAGFETRRYHINGFNNFASRGFLEFQSTQDFLEGNLEVAFVGTGQTDRGFRARDLSGFFQDDWKVSRRLTLNLGVRYDYLGPSSDVKGRLGNFDPSLLGPTARAIGGVDLLAGFILPASANFGSIHGTPGVSDSTLRNNDLNNFAPRVGLAWDVKGDGKTAVRAGYGIYYVRISNQTLLQLLTAAPFFQLSAAVFPGTNVANPYPNLPVASQFPIFPTPQAFQGFDPQGNALFDNNPSLTLNPFDRGLRTPYVGNWNLTVQRELPAHFTVEFGYLGSEAVKLLAGQQLNQARLANVANPIVVGGADGIPQTTITTNTQGNLNARVGVLGFSSQGLNTVTENAHSNYNAFLLTVNRRTQNMFIQGSYTFSKSIDNESGNAAGQQDLGVSAGNNLDLRPNRGLSDFDRTHRIQVAYQYNIPGFRTGALRYALGNWSAGGLTTFQSGLPGTFTCASCQANVFGLQPGGTEPEVIGNLNNLVRSGSPEQFTTNPNGTFNTGVLGPTVNNPAGTQVSGLNTFGGPGNQTFTIEGALLGDLGRNPSQFRGPFQQDWDVYIAKKFPIFENSSLTFRAEAFNVFNHPNFALPNLSVGSQGFGNYFATVGGPRILQLALKFEF